MALGDDLLADRSIQGPMHVLEEQRPRIAVVEPADRQLREPGEDVIADSGPCGADDRDPLGKEPARDEPEDLFRCLIEPMRVVDDAARAVCLRRPRRGMSASRARPGTDSGPALSSENGSECFALWVRQSFELIEHLANS